jgi:thiamine pyrophosphate-dependent acetolactate synthase large subunit-like protein
MARYGLPILIIVINNNGVYAGLDELPSQKALQIPVTSLSTRCAYDRMAEGLGAQVQSFERKYRRTKRRTTTFLCPSPSLILLFV